MKAISNARECPSCGGGHKTKPFCLYENGWFCFSCGYTKAADRGYSIQVRLPLIPEFPDACPDFSKFSLEAQLWLTKYNIDEKATKEYGIYYCNDNSLILTNNKEGEQLFYQKRNMKERFITSYGTKRPHLLAGVGDLLVIVEDVISAIRVHQAGFSSICLWGTKLSYEDLCDWFKKYDKCLVWLDNDKEKQTNSGQEAAAKIIKMGTSVLKNKYGFSIGSKEIVNVVADEDPKCYSNTSIREFIRGALNE